MNLFTEIHVLVLESAGRDAGRGQLPDGLDLGNVTVEPPRDPAHGDMATNAAMVLAKPAGPSRATSPRLWPDPLRGDDRIAAAEVAGPGFLNLRLAPSCGTRDACGAAKPARISGAPTWGRASA